MAQTTPLLVWLLLPLCACALQEFPAFEAADLPQDQLAGDADLHLIPEADLPRDPGPPDLPAAPDDLLEEPAEDLTEDTTAPEEVLEDVVEDVMEPDAGPPPTGEPCQEDAQCQVPGVEGYCLQGDHRDGYCSSACQEDAQCGERKNCVEGQCRVACLTGPPPAGSVCREGYGCWLLEGTVFDWGFCGPACQSNQDCPAGLRCAFEGCVHLP